MFLSDQCMYCCTSLWSLSSIVSFSWVRALLRVSRLSSVFILISDQFLVFLGLHRDEVNLQQERGEILQHGECYGFIYCIIIDQRDHVDWPVGGGGDLQCVRAAPAQCFSSLAQWSPAPALQSGLAPVSLLLSAAPPSSPAVQSDISQWSGWDQWRAAHGLLSPSLCFSGQPGQSTNY